MNLPPEDTNDDPPTYRSSSEYGAVDIVMNQKEPKFQSDVHPKSDVDVSAYFVDLDAFIQSERDKIPPSQRPCPSGRVLKNGYIDLQPDIRSIARSRDKDSSSTTSSESSVPHHVMDLLADISFKSHSKPSPTDYIGVDIYERILHDIRVDNYHPLHGMILVTISAILYAVLNLSVTSFMFESHIPWQELMFIRMSISWLVTAICIVYQYRCKLFLCGPLRHRRLLLLRSVLCWAAIVQCWWSFEFLPVGDGMTLAMSFPIWVALFEQLMRPGTSTDDSSHDPEGESIFVQTGLQSVNLWNWLCALGGLSGIALVSHPTFLFHEQSLSRTDIGTGISLGLGSAICAGAQYVIVHHIKRDVHWLQVEQTTAAVSAFILCPLAACTFALYDQRYNSNTFFVHFVGYDTVKWSEMMCLGVLGFIASALLTRGAQLGVPSRTAVCLYLEIPFIYIGQIYGRRDTSPFIPGPDVFLGMFLIILAVIMHIIRARKLRRTEKEKGQTVLMVDMDDSDRETSPLITEDVTRSIVVISDRIFNDVDSSNQRIVCV